MKAYGWAVIWPFYIDDDESTIPDNWYIDNINAQVETLDLTRVVTIVNQNGTGMVQVTMDRNHDTGEIDRVIDLFRYMGQIASGSYGQIHIRDEEGRRRGWNTMDMAVLARGEVTMHKDPFFNPCIPNIEGQFPEDGLYTITELTPRYLPIGSVVTLEGGEQKLMIYGRCQKDTANDTVFDYVGCPYPEGNTGPETSFLFNHENIAWVHYLGYTTEEEDALNIRLTTLASDHAAETIHASSMIDDA